MPRRDVISNDEWVDLFNAGGSKRALALDIARKIADRTKSEEDLARLDERVRRSLADQPRAGVREMARGLGISYQAFYRSMTRRGLAL